MLQTSVVEALRQAMRQGERFHQIYKQMILCGLANDFFRRQYTKNPSDGLQEQRIRGMGIFQLVTAQQLPKQLYQKVHRVLR